jgi:hypothetical protein
MHCAAALPAERRVLARRGWAGEKSGLSEQPARTLERPRGCPCAYDFVLLK